MNERSNFYAQEHVSMPSGAGDDSEEVGLSFSCNLPTGVSVLEHDGVGNFKKKTRLDQAVLGLRGFSASLQLHGQQRRFPVYWTELVTILLA